MPKPNWQDRYDKGDLPWDTGEVDPHLAEFMGSRELGKGRALDLGCGTGTNALWLAGRGFDVTGVDISARAIEMALAKKEKGTTNCRFEVTDILKQDIAGGPFDLVFDRGCFHVFDDDIERAEFARRVAGVLTPGAQWLSLIGSTEGPARDHGPPRRSVRDVVKAIEPVLQIIELRSIGFRANLPSPARAWFCLSQTRDHEAQPSTLGDVSP